MERLQQLRTTQGTTNGSKDAAEARSPPEDSPPGASHGPSLWPKTRLARGQREGEGVLQEDREEQLPRSYLSYRFMAKPGTLGSPGFMQI